MNELETEILRTLDELDFAVRSIRSTGVKPDLQPIFARLDALAAELKTPAQGQLNHFLVNKSYEKARALLRQRADAVQH